MLLGSMNHTLSSSREGSLVQGMKEEGEALSSAPRRARAAGFLRETWASLVSPGHTEWPSWAHSHPEEIAGEWAGWGALSGEERNKLAQFYTKKST